MISKLALGTVQFGLDYGINNLTGQVKISDIQTILAFANSVGLDTLDTASLYGSSEENLGQCDLDNFKIISKLPPSSAVEINDILQQSFNRLQAKSLYGYLFHHFSTFEKDEKILDELQNLKAKGKIQKIGFSLYNPIELEILLDKNIDFDLVQVPYNIFDQRFDDYFSILKSKGIEVHTRSSFLQGLFFKDLSTIPTHFQSIFSKLEQLNQYDIDKAALCLNFVISNPNIDKAVIGVDSVEQLKRNVESLESLEKVEGIRAELKTLRVNDELIINPSLWQLK
jgi:aryl-alcohol dehydrogenase-like predicted oxidoreductase